jgi:hypothetical protein
MLQIVFIIKYKTILCCVVLLLYQFLNIVNFKCKSRLVYEFITVVILILIVLVD